MAKWLLYFHIDKLVSNYLIWIVHMGGDKKSMHYWYSSINYMAKWMENIGLYLLYWVFHHDNYGWICKFLMMILKKKKLHSHGCTLKPETYETTLRLKGICFVRELIFTLLALSYEAQCYNFHFQFYKIRQHRFCRAILFTNKFGHGNLVKLQRV